MSERSVASEESSSGAATSQQRPAWEWLVTVAMSGVVVSALAGVLLANSPTSGTGSAVGLLLSAVGGFCFLFCVVTLAVNLGLRMSRE